MSSFLAVADRNSSSLWLEIFTTFPQWNGTYLHNYSMFPCFINVNSVHTTGINATFSDDDSEFDMSGWFFTLLMLKFKRFFLMMFSDIVQFVFFGPHHTPMPSGSMYCIMGYFRCGFNFRDFRGVLGL